LEPVFPPDFIFFLVWAPVFEVVFAADLEPPEDLASILVPEPSPVAREADFVDFTFDRPPVPETACRPAVFVFTFLEAGPLPL